MKNKIIILVFTLILLLTISGCDTVNNDNYIELEFVKCGEIDGLVSTTLIYYDTQTTVMYAVTGHRMSVLLNSDGTPMLYEVTN